MRIVGLDILRAIAVLLVIMRHSALENNYIHKFGWLGVDLFFVISGFLVSGLLFSEYKKTGKFNIRRFLIRRGFKIYPSFYFFLIAAVFINWYFLNQVPSISRLLSEIFYLQNYIPNIFTHTWSLAVEEHFYIILACTLLLFYKLNLFKPNNKYILYLSMLFIAIFCFRSFMYTSNVSSFSLQQTHLRADGIILGVQIAYMYHFTDYVSKFSKYKWLLFPLSAFLLLPGFLWDAGSFRMNIAGLSSVNLGFGIIVFLIAGSHQTSEWKQPWLKAIGWVGMHSYSIYLWHLMTNFFLLKFFHFNIYIMTIIYVVASLSVGIFFSITIENTFLKMRESKWVKKWY